MLRAGASRSRRRGPATRARRRVRIDAVDRDHRRAGAPFDTTVNGGVIAGSDSADVGGDEQRRGADERQAHRLPSVSRHERFGIGGNAVGGPARAPSTPSVAMRTA